MSGQLSLVTGASGYVGGRLVQELEARGEGIRCLARRPEFLRPRVGHGTEVVRGDVLDSESLKGAMAGVDVAYYLIHSMASARDFEAEDRRAALNLAAAAREAGVRRIVYLGGLGREPGLSRHLRSRQEVGRILRESGVATIELRASIVIGSGSLSFEMVRALVQKLPVMITPRWVTQPAQPLAIEDLVAYLVSAADVDMSESVVVEIGGADRVSYMDIMKEFARQRGLKRVMVRLPVLSPRLSSLWLGLVTPVYARVGRELIDSIRNTTTVEDDSARRLFPDVRPRGIREAIARALLNEDREFAVTRWSDALSSGAAPRQWGGAVFGSRIVDSRSMRVPRAPREAFAPVLRIGGDAGWYYGNWLWRFRGFLDLLVGGVGVRRGRRDPDNLVPGDVLDFWRVEAIEPDTLLRLAAEMKVPGRAWLQFEVEPDGTGSILRQTAIFDPFGRPSTEGLAPGRRRTNPACLGVPRCHRVVPFGGQPRGVDGTRPGSRPPIGRRGAGGRTRRQRRRPTRKRGGPMDLAVKVIQVVIALGIYNVWLVRFRKSTSWRGGTARNLKEEFEVYGLPGWFMGVVGSFKLLFATLLIAGIWFPVVTRPAAAGMAALMLGAVAMHVKVKDPLMRSLPALTMLVLSVIVAVA